MPDKMSAEEKAKWAEAKKRREKRRENRTDIGVKPRNLDAPVREGFRRRWVNNDKGRIEAFREDGWEVVQDDGTIAKRVGRKEDNSDLHGVLMEIPEEFFQENLEEGRAQIVDPTKMPEAQIGPGEYSPSGADSALTNKLR